MCSSSFGISKGGSTVEFNSRCPSGLDSTTRFQKNSRIPNFAFPPRKNPTSPFGRTRGGTDGEEAGPPGPDRPGQPNPVRTARPRSTNHRRGDSQPHLNLLLLRLPLPPHRIPSRLPSHIPSSVSGYGYKYE